MAQCTLVKSFDSKPIVNRLYADALLFKVEPVLHLMHQQLLVLSFALARQSDSLCVEVYSHLG